MYRAPKYDPPAEADILTLMEGCMETLHWLGVPRSAGVTDQGMLALGFLRNLGGPAISWRQDAAREVAEIHLQAPTRARLRETGSEQTGAVRYPSARETGAEGDGSQEIGVPHSTDEAGEPLPGEPGGGKGAPDTSNRWRDRCPAYRSGSPSQRNNSG